MKHVTTQATHQTVIRTKIADPELYLCWDNGWHVHIEGNGVSVVITLPDLPAVDRFTKRAGRVLGNRPSRLTEVRR